MKKMNRFIKILAAGLAVLFVFSAFYVFADTESYQLLHSSELSMGGGLQLTTARSRNTEDESLLTENYITYKPNFLVRPIVAFGHDIRGAASFDRAAEIEEEENGLNVIGGANGDFFVLATEVAIGACIRNGIVVTSEPEGYQSVGFTSGGRARIGAMNLRLILTDASTGEVLPQISLNKSLEKNGGMMLYSSAYGPSNAASAPTLNVRIRIDFGEMRIGHTVRGTVEDVFEAESATPLEDDELLVSVYQETPYATILPTLREFTPGHTMELSITADPGWEEMEYTVGGMERLIDSGEIQELESSSRHPRTAIGIKQDGDVVLYTADGRDSGHSVGLSLQELAVRMQELGCRDAINLDGGSSTQLHLTYPGETASTTVNKQSDPERRASNYIMFATEKQPESAPSSIFVYPHDSMVLAGSSVEFSAKAVDRSFNAVDLPAAPVFSVGSSLGSFDGNVFTAQAGSSGTVDVSATSGYLGGAARITVVSDPDSVQVTKAGSSAPLSKLVVPPGGEVELSASAVYKTLPVTADPASFNWSVSEGSATITAEGSFTAPAAGDSAGKITVSCGTTSQTIAYVVDETAPELTAAIDGTTLNATITDELDESLTRDNIAMRVDGITTTAFGFEPETGVFNAELTTQAGLHHIILNAQDASGNRVRTGLAYEVAPYESGTVFADLPAGNWATKYVEYLHQNGILFGRKSGEELYYAPDDNMSRQDFASVVARLLGGDLAQYEGTALDYIDAADISNYALPSVRAVTALGVMGGKGGADGLRFDPKGYITRQEAMAVVGRMFGSGYAINDLSGYSDAGQVASWAKPYVGLLVQINVVSGSGGRLRPLDPITRAEVAALIYNCY